MAASAESPEQPPPNREAYESRFRASQERLAAALEFRTGCFARIAECVDESIALIASLKRDFRDFAECDVAELEELKITLSRQLTLSLIVFGRGKTGKSTLLNQLMREWPESPATDVGLFPSADFPCTARITIASFGTSKMVSLVGREGTVSEQRPFGTSADIMGLINLRGESRETAELAKHVRISVPCSLLRNRLEVVDSPGMGENANMNQVVRDFLKCVQSGLIVYVINGAEGYKPEPDRENIQFLMEQQSMQKLFVANRLDFDFIKYCNDEVSLDDVDDYCDFEDPVSVLRCLQQSQGFRLTHACHTHSLERLDSVQKAVHKHHPECIDGETSLLGVSAGSVKAFGANKWKFPHAPYLDSFLEFESRIADLVYENGRQHLQVALQTTKNQLLRVHVCQVLSKMLIYMNKMQTQVPTEMISRALTAVNSAYDQVSKSLRSLAEDFSTDSSDGGNPLIQLRDRFVKGGVAKGENALDPSLVMREAEAELINFLVRAHGNTREARAAIRLLCDFKDSVVSCMWNWLKSGYQSAFHNAVRKLAAFSMRECLGIPNQRAFASHLAMLTSAFEPDEAAFREACVGHLSDSMRQALPGLVGGSEFAQIISAKTDCLKRLLDYFLKGVDPQQQAAAAIGSYCEQLREKMENIESRLNELQRFVQVQSSQESAKLLGLKQLKRRFVILHLYLTGLSTLLNWMADYNTDECMLHFG